MRKATTRGLASILIGGALIAGTQSGCGNVGGHDVAGAFIGGPVGGLVSTHGERKFQKELVREMGQEIGKQIGNHKKQENEREERPYIEETNYGKIDIGIIREEGRPVVFYTLEEKEGRVCFVIDPRSNYKILGYGGESKRYGDLNSLEGKPAPLEIREAIERCFKVKGIPTGNPSKMEVIESIKMLRELRKEGRFTEEEYERKVQPYLDQL